MRVADRPTPPCVLDPGAFARWPVRPVVAVAGRRDVLTYDDPALEWDAPMLEWDEDLVPGFVDATCDLQGLEIETGNQDEHANIDTGHCVVQLDNASGRWSRFEADGAQAVHGPGFELAIWALEDDGTVSWMFDGVVTAYNDTTGIVEIEAFDGFATLAQPIGTYTPGVAGQLPGPRMTAIMAAAGRAGMRTRFDAGDVTLTAQSTTDAPLEQLQTVAASDGGIVFCEPDGTIVYLKRTWRAGRSDQTVIPVASDNVCSVSFVVWDAVLSNNDDGIGDTVIFENVAHLRAQAPAGQPITGVVFTETDHQWTTQAEGDTLAAVVYSAHNDPRVNLEEFTLYLYDPNQIGIYQAVRWRLIDVLRFVHDQHFIGGVARLDVNMLVAGISHDVTPDAWVMTVKTTKAIGYNVNNVWNPPADPYWWDLAGTVWGF